MAWRAPPARRARRRATAPARAAGPAGGRPGRPPPRRARGRRPAAPASAVSTPSSPTFWAMRLTPAASSRAVPLAAGSAALAAGDHRLQPRQESEARRILGAEAARGPQVAGRPHGLDLHQQGVAVAVGLDGDAASAGCPRSRPCASGRRASASRRCLPALQGLGQGRLVHVGEHQHLQGRRVLHDRRGRARRPWRSRWAAGGGHGRTSTPWARSSRFSAGMREHALVEDAGGQRAGDVGLPEDVGEVARLPCPARGDQRDRQPPREPLLSWAMS